MVLARKRNVSGDVLELELHPRVDSTHHAIGSVHGPPRSSPALFQLWVTSSMHERKFHTVQTDLQRQGLSEVEDLSAPWNFVVRVQADTKEQQCLDRICISGIIAVTDVPVKCLLVHVCRHGWKER